MPQQEWTAMLPTDACHKFTLDKFNSTPLVHFTLPYCALLYFTALYVLLLSQSTDDSDDFFAKKKTLNSWTSVMWTKSVHCAVRTYVIWCIIYANFRLQKSRNT